MWIRSSVKEPELRWKPELRVGEELPARKPEWIGYHPSAGPFFIFFCQVRAPHSGVGACRPTSFQKKQPTFQSECYGWEAMWLPTVRSISMVL
ncbi:hypothetical protein ACFX14_001441 [Malus domestica]